MREHKHLIVNAVLLDKLDKHDVIFMQYWISSLVDKINMEIWKGPFVDYLDEPGNEGITGVAIIKTSHIAFHTWTVENKTKFDLDVYTCSSLDPQVIYSHLKRFFTVKEVSYKYLDRETELKEITNP